MKNGKYRDSDGGLLKKYIFAAILTKLLQHVRHCIKSKKDHYRQIGS